ncbi:2-oxo-4-hydroxy-4-carboxy-5-ureidoimidazoline decarboxylase [Vibrio sp. M60_M31a]
MKIRMPFDSIDSLLRSAEIAFTKLKENDWLEAFAGHPMIGDLNSRKRKFGKDSAKKSKRTLNRLLPMCCKNCYAQSKIPRQIWIHFYRVCHQQDCRRDAQPTQRQNQSFEG